MNINPETLALAIKIAQALEGNEQSTPSTDQGETVQAQASSLAGRRVLVRDHRAGVYCGTLQSADVVNKVGTVTDARQVYYWEGAAATPGIAARGVGSGSKIGPVVELVELCDVVQIMPMTHEAWATIEDAPVWMS